MRPRTGYLLAAITFLLLTPLAFLAAGRLQVPWWLGLFLLLFLGGVAGGIFSLARSLARRRFNEKAVRRELERSDAPEPDPPPDQLQELEEQWQKGIDALNGSHLKKLGDPLHALPWYLVLGASGSGKSSALRSARLDSPLFPPAGGALDPTPHCRWWFFEKAVFIDTSGRYAAAHRDERDWEEWETFVTLLAKHRRREPLNGVVVAVAADRLLKSTHEEIREDADGMRRRLHELMRVFQVRFPVYLLVTKCDLIEGMQEFSALLSEEVLSRPMGMLNEGFSLEPPEMAQKATVAVADQVRFFRLQLLHDPHGSHDPASFALFPENFAALEAPLAQYVAAAFQLHHSHETPALRGVFFGSSVQQGGAPVTRRHPDSQRSEKLRPIPGCDHALFLRDLFGAVLPRDRSLLSPTSAAMRWRSVTGRVALVSCALVLAGLCAAATFSFTKNLRIIRGAAAHLSAARQESRLSTMEALERLRTIVGRVEEQNSSWTLPRFSLNASVEVERALKYRYCQRFKKTVLGPCDRELQQSADLLRHDSSDDLFAHYAMHLTRRLNLLEARLRGATFAQLRREPLPPAPVAPGMLQDRGTASFGSLYLCYLAWCDDPSALGAEARLLRGRLQEALAQRQGDLRWLSRWVDREEGLEPVTVAHFWGGLQAGGEEPVLRPTFTHAGRVRLASLVREVEKAAGADRVSRGKTDLEAWLRSASFEAWRVFARDFPCGARRLQGNSECQRLCGVVGSGIGPYFALLDRLTLELEPLSRGQRTPAWLKQLYLLQTTRARGLALAKGGGRGAVAAAEAKILAEIEKKVGAAADGANPEAQQAMVAAWRDYLAALNEITAGVATATQVFQLASQTYSDDPATGRGPFFAAYHAVNRLHAGLADAGAEFPWQLVTGPMDYLWWYVRKETAAQLQKQWEEQVVPAAAELPPSQAAQALLGPDGLAWKFAKGTAAPFLVPTAQGFRPKVVLGEALPLNEAFFSFMRSGTRVVASALAKQASYTVGVRAFPTEANADARVQPHGSRLDLLCTGNTQSLVNMNYPSGRTLYWTPDNCGDVVLQVEVGELQLSKRYGGPQGFPSFLRDFRTGSRTFSSAEFPGEKATLDLLGIRQIRVNYHFTGSAPVLQQASAERCATVPRIIGKMR